jgi:hypothetical protein
MGIITLVAGMVITLRMSAKNSVRELIYYTMYSKSYLAFKTQTAKSCCRTNYEISTETHTPPEILTSK